eukprot:5099336-Pyramimonas_sp.AAC.1
MVHKNNTSTLHIGARGDFSKASGFAESTPGPDRRFASAHPPRLHPVSLAPAAPIFRPSLRPPPRSVFS